MENNNQNLPKRGPRSSQSSEMPLRSGASTSKLSHIAARPTLMNQRDLEFDLNFISSNVTISEDFCNSARFSISDVTRQPKEQHSSSGPLPAQSVHDAHHSKQLSGDTRVHRPNSYFLQSILYYTVLYSKILSFTWCPTPFSDFRYESHDGHLLTWCQLFTNRYYSGLRGDD